MKDLKAVKKQIYDQTAKMIASLHFQGRLQEEEMNFLLSFLDWVMIKNNQDSQELLAVLQEFYRREPDCERAEIIKNILLNVNWEQEADRNSLLALIQELMPD